MKICIVTFEYDPQVGGIAHAVDRIARNLAKKGVDVHIVVVTPDKNGSFSESNGRGPTIHRFGPFSGDLKYINDYESKNLERFILDLDQKHGFDLFHAFTIFPCGHIVTKTAKRIGKQCIVSGRGGDGTDELLNGNIEEKRWTIRNADFLTFVSSEMKEYVNRFEPCNTKSEVILNSVDPSGFLYLPKMKKPELKGLVVGIATTIRETKGFEYLLEAFSRFSKEYEATLLLAGGFRTKEIQDRYLQLIDKLGIRDKVVITGILKHKFILNYINLMDVYVLPSLFSEGCPNSLLEAMYLGKPAIGSNVGAIPEIIKDLKNGLLVESKNSDQIYDYLKLLKEDKELREKLGKEAKDTTITKFNATTETKAWFDIYKSIILDNEKSTNKLLAAPYNLNSVMIEPSSRCNLKCPLCPAGRGEIPRKEDMSLANFKKIADQLPDSLERISLWNYGEPFLNKDIFSMVNYASKKGFKTAISTNMNYVSEGILDKILSSELDELIISLDGASQETYTTYRKSGNFDKALEHIKKLCFLKKERNLGKPIITLQFIVMRQNEHEADKIRKISLELGVDKLKLKSVHGPEGMFESYLPKNKKFRRKIGSEHSVYFCNMPWTSLVINCDGKVMPCCYAHHKEEYVLGNAFTQDIRKIWNGRAYKEFRRKMLSDKGQIGICKNCRGHLMEGEICQE